MLQGQAPTDWNASNLAAMREEMREDSHPAPAKPLARGVLGATCRQNADYTCQKTPNPVSTKLTRQSEYNAEIIYFPAQELADKLKYPA